MLDLETPRLLLRDWKAADLEPFSQMNADETVMRYFPKPLTAAETEAFAESIAAEFQECGFGFYAVEEKATGSFLGFIGLHRAAFKADFTPCVEIGWRLRKEAWGKGYATEGAAACLAHGFGTLGLREIYSFTARINQPSINVMTKIGLRFLRTFPHPRVGPEHPLNLHVLYHLDQDGYEAQRNLV